MYRRKIKAGTKIALALTLVAMLWVGGSDKTTAIINNNGFIPVSHVNTLRDDRNSPTADDPNPPGGRNLNPSFYQSCSGVDDHNQQGSIFWLSPEDNPQSDELQLSNTTDTEEIQANFSGYVCDGALRADGSMDNTRLTRQNAIRESWFNYDGQPTVSITGPGDASGVTIARNPGQPYLRMGWNAMYSSPGYRWANQNFRPTRTLYTLSNLSSITMPGEYTINISVRQTVVVAFYVIDPGNPNSTRLRYYCQVRSPSGQSVQTNDGRDTWNQCESRTVQFRARLIVTGNEPLRCSRTPGGNVEPGTVVTVRGRGGARPYSWTVTGSPVGNTPSNPSPGNVADFTVSWPQAGTGTARVTDADGNTETCTVSIVSRPYHKVFGGDVIVGGRLNLDGSCSGTEANATLIGWYDGLEDRGSGTQLAAFALGIINNFASGQIRSPTTPNNLTFANTTGTFGGGFAAQNLDCSHDFWQHDAGSSIDLPYDTLGIFGGPDINGNAGERVYYRNGDLDTNTSFLGNIDIARAARVTLYVEGDLYIRRDILYAGGSYSSIDQIPSLRVVAKGNIYVHPSVTELNGLFVAGGTFSTCGTDGDDTAVKLISSCGQPLTVYGAVYADSILLKRTPGSLGQSVRAQGRGNPSPAERFIYTPELWLTSGFNSGEGDADSYYTLPPVL